MSETKFEGLVKKFMNRVHEANALAQYTLDYDKLKTANHRTDEARAAVIAEYERVVRVMLELEKLANANIDFYKAERDKLVAENAKLKQELDANLNF